MSALLLQDSTNGFSTDSIDLQTDQKYVVIQIAKADLQKIAESISQAQGVYKQLKDQRQQLSAAVEALKLMSEWQASSGWRNQPQLDFNHTHNLTSIMHDHWRCLY